MAKVIGVSASKAYLGGKIGGISDRISRVYSSSHSISNKLASYYTNNLINSLGLSDKINPKHNNNIKEYFSRMLHIKNMYGLDDDFIHSVYNYAYSVIKDGILHGGGHPHFNSINNKISSKLSDEISRKLYDAYVKTSDVYLKHAVNYTTFRGNVHNVDPDSGVRHTIIGNTKVNVNSKGEDKKPKMSSSERLKRIGIASGIGLGLAGLGGLIAYGAYRFMKDREDIEIGSPYPEGDKHG
ncbi:MAG: hypothetical protein QXD03_02195 [Candidatus Anstonellales archaeon]